MAWAHIQIKAYTRNCKTRVEGACVVSRESRGVGPEGGHGSFVGGLSRGVHGPELVKQPQELREALGAERSAGGGGGSGGGGMHTSPRSPDNFGETGPPDQLPVPLPDNFPGEDDVGLRRG